ncbi:hypothetical protein QUC32_28575 (plasmid) [Novosphingobium resinovorum]|jgi:hypothetical protein|uniref:Nucleotidyl transferase AbiEii toxin, Type IV TA system n=1 Tax=Novosphingobium resinovorum TaxID=158500 RepID=A0A1D8AFA4_9SPHN|nr:MULTISPECIES: hypothetical protein [Sphingomonadaceae]AOR80780.1 hypothetical protein BES08_28670 [Novosphingobium resinovorum]EJU09173.1 hypothetical protein LH128_30259 [Sphingomonas sp. LH128]MBF7015634.1 hypothetical protein [Novosphingobium sp. HR1a]WJM30309.1 hypothetical protein QUC32_28575 [Novosphingobium resinovorum]
MVTGVDRFRAHFAAHEHQYVLIGGAACELIMDDAGLDFRATRDLDIVLIVEALDPAFSAAFMAFVETSGYEVQQRAEGARILYRFAKPAKDGYPAMLELFSNLPDGFELASGSHLTPIPIAEEAASLSAILLDDDYYAFLKTMARPLDGIPVLDEAGMIPFKARAWIDLSRRQAQGEKVDSRDVKKHCNDVARMLQLLSPEASYEHPGCYQRRYAGLCRRVGAQDDFVPKRFGVAMTKEVAIDRLRQAYRL